ncbi:MULTISPECIES: DUF397 domain-containing protein [Streptomyces]|uniref:DUF397 domain-containing protein n=1 Tax=Streptomyces TaxID=1883 RepID=UPI002271EDAE|nr:MULTISPECIES: DUF397 domain-containing protein [unclassified Streptomyces]MCY0941466.1 DUF397 domain-containing protein [Streptomyces sp. H34-AA3]MCY0949178.1 DUF397 domain-containing protein [Streptomyces sp. H27-S2]MCZ4084873.1 DUF397 domain-containing protein [Streptomyces sp. H34-S5]
MSATLLATSGLLIGARWRRSSRSTGMNNCVEAAALTGGLLAVRDSKRADGPAVLFTGPAWNGFLAQVRADLHP